MKTKSVGKNRTDITVAKVIRAYQVFKSCRKVGEILGISYQTVRRHLKSVDYNMNPIGGGYRKGKHYPSFHRGCLANWLREHPGKRLPVKIKDIITLTGCSKDSVSCYIYRRKKSINEDGS